MANQMRTMQGCCCDPQPCAVSFTITSLGGNRYRFTDTTPGKHTRVWTSADGGTATTAVWDHTFPDGNLYWVKLTIHRTDEDDICHTTKFVGAGSPCGYCVPTDLPTTVYVTIGSVGPGPQPAGQCKAVVLPRIPGTWAVDGTSCTWGPNVYDLAICQSCGAGRSEIVMNGLRLSAYLGLDAGNVTLTGEVSAGAYSQSTDCNIPYHGGGGLYRKNLGPPPLLCSGTHVLNRVTGAGVGSFIDGYGAWPSTITVLIP